MRLLLTGFEPFGGEATNPSADVARAIASDPPPNIEVVALVLPVRGGVGLEVLAPAFDAGDYDAWLGLGQAGARTALSVERVGINVLIDRDEETAAVQERAIVEGGPAGYFSQWPVHDLARHIADAGVPAVVSNTVGTYICNEVTYAMQHHLAGRGLHRPSGFIHRAGAGSRPSRGAIDGARRADGGRARRRRVHPRPDCWRSLSLR
jgi:pyroglutamyl-peptidase